jgi:hypothetical protein
MARHALSLLLLSIGLTACSTSSVTGTGSAPVTALVVDPVEFLGGVACVDAPGAMRLYVATVVDVSPPARAGALRIASQALPSSPPVPCHQQVEFTRIVPGREYVADIEGYDRTDIKPDVIGSKIMVDAAGTYVSPRWRTSCGRTHVAEPPSDSGATDAGVVVDAAPSARPQDGGFPYLDCLGPSWPVGGRPPLYGPVCAVGLETITLKGCTPLER